MSTTTDTPTDAAEGWLSKVQKLLAMAENPAATPAERDAFSAKAEALMVRYAITDAMLQSRGDRPQDTIESRRITLTRPYPEVKRTLVHAIAVHLGARAIFHTRQEANPDGGPKWSRVTVHEVTIIGFTSDLAKVELLLASLLVQMSHAVAASKKTDMGYGDTLRVYRKSMAIGFAEAVERRMRQLMTRTRAEAKVESPGTDLVLADRSDRVEAAVREQFPRLGYARALNARSAAGYNGGYAAGQRADLGQPRVGGAGRSIASR